MYAHFESSSSSAIVLMAPSIVALSIAARPLHTTPRVIDPKRECLKGLVLGALALVCYCGPAFAYGIVANPIRRPPQLRFDLAPIAFGTEFHDGLPGPRGRNGSRYRKWEDRVSVDFDRD
jgi:hypothetical protein